MIRINLYDYRRVLQEVAVQKGITAALAMLVAGIVLTGLAFMSDQMRVTTATEEAQALETQVSQLKGKYDAVQALKKKQTDLRAMIKSLGDLRSSKVPFTRLLEDVGDRLPSGLWLDTLRQSDEEDLKRLRVPILFLDPEDKTKKPGPKPTEEEPKHLFIEFKGKAVSDREVARFMEQLETVSYLDHVVLNKSTREWVGKEPVRQFTVYAHVAGSGPKPK